jgi:hypothetical protein
VALNKIDIIKKEKKTSLCYLKNGARHFEKKKKNMNSLSCHDLETRIEWQ